MVTQFEEGVKEKKEEYKTKTSRQKYLKNEDYREFKEAIFVNLPSLASFNELWLNSSCSKLITKMRLCLR